MLNSSQARNGRWRSFLGLADGCVIGRVQNRVLVLRPPLQIIGLQCRQQHEAPIYSWPHAPNKGQQHRHGGYKVENTCHWICEQDGRIAFVACANCSHCTPSDLLPSEAPKERNDLSWIHHSSKCFGDLDDWADELLVLENGTDDQGLLICR